MNWIRFRGALIRGFWTFVMPAVGAGVTAALKPGALENIGVTNGALILGIGAALYGLKKLFWPNTVI